MKFPGGGGSRGRIGFPTQASFLAAAFAAMVPYPGSLDQARAVALVTGLKADGLWSKLDGLVLHDGFSTSQASRVNLKDPTNVATANGTLTFTAYAGFRGDGATGYLDYLIAENAAGLQWGTLGHIGAWVNSASLTQAAILGLSAGTANITGPVLAGVPGSATARIHNGTAASGTSGNHTGHLLASRTASTTLRYDRNGVTEDTHTTAAAAVPGAGTFLGLKNGATFGDSQLAVAHRGAPLTAAEGLLLYNRLVTYRASPHN